MTAWITSDFGALYPAYRIKGFTQHSRPLKTTEKPQAIHCDAARLGRLDDGEAGLSCTSGTIQIAS